MFIINIVLVLLLTTICYFELKLGRGGQCECMYLFESNYKQNTQIQDIPKLFSYTTAPYQPHNLKLQFPIYL